MSSFFNAQRVSGLIPLMAEIMHRPKCLKLYTPLKTIGLKSKNDKKNKVRKILVSHDAAHDGCHVRRACFGAIVRRHNLTLDVVCRNPVVTHWHCSATSSLRQSLIRGWHRQVQTGLAWNQQRSGQRWQRSWHNSQDAKQWVTPLFLWQIEPRIPILSKMV